MSITCGFYNAVDDDRLYDASQMSSMFNGIINDGVFESIGTYLAVEATTGMVVAVGKGRAWFNSTWTNNDALYPLTIGQSETILNRIDTIVLEVNANDSVRNNTFKVVSGIPATNPVHPTLTNASKVYQYPLADIYVGAGVTSILQEKITNRVGTSDCPFITGILETLAIDSLVAQWGNEFDNWLNHIRDLFGEDPAGALQTQIDTLNSTTVKKAVLSTIEEVNTFARLTGIYTVHGVEVISGYGTDYDLIHMVDQSNTGCARQLLIVAQIGSSPIMFVRGSTATNTWGSWDRKYSVASKPTPSEIGADTSAEVSTKINVLRHSAPITTGGTGSTLTATVTNFTLSDGATVRIKLHTEISAGATLNVNSLGAKTILTSKGTSIPAGAITGSYLTLIYNGTSFILQGEGGGASTSIRRYGSNHEAQKISTFQVLMNCTSDFFKTGG